MAFDSFKYTSFPTSQALKAGQAGESPLINYGADTGNLAFKNLYQLLYNNGRVDPRLLAKAQAANARDTQRQQDMARAGAARGGIGGGGLNAALQSAIGAAGSTRAANMRYQDIADSYGRNQQNLGLFNQLVQQPSLEYSRIGTEWGLAQQAQKNAQKQGWLNFGGNLLGSAGNAVGK